MIQNISRSLEDLLGKEYINAVCNARTALTGEPPDKLKALAEEKVDFYPADFGKRQAELMALLGERITSSFGNEESGAPSASFHAAQNNCASPVAGLGCYRVGEDGRLYFAAKSEHYHIPLGHDFPGFRLIEIAKRLGITNATHNNTRGYITRLLEKSLVAAANGIDVQDSAKMSELLQKKEPGIINRVINLETGSLAVEAALKMMLSRFYSINGQKAEYQDRIPVFLVMADNAGGPTANYHGTTVIAQTLRGLWPAFSQKAENGKLYKTVPVAINDIDDFKAKLKEYNTPPFKTAGFCHEIILMNYGAIKLNESYLKETYRLCRENDTPVLCDEIQSCAWYDGLFLFRKYGLTPDFVSIGKGFPNGAYPASKILFSGAFDKLDQFGALVTNGQEELASLSYLITMEFIRYNGEHIKEIGTYYHEQVKKLALNHPEFLNSVEGDGHMTALCFHTGEAVIEFCKIMNNKYCIDISSQAYKPNCPPVALIKLPLIVNKDVVDGLINRMEECICALKGGNK